MPTVNASKASLPAEKIAVLPFTHRFVALLAPAELGLQNASESHVPFGALPAPGVAPLLSQYLKAA